MLEPPPYSPHPAGSSVVTVTDDDTLSPSTAPPPEYHTVIQQDRPSPDVQPTPGYLQDNNEVIHVVATSDVLPPLPEYQREAGADSPPTYESLFGRVKAAQQSSTSNFGLCKSLCQVFLSSVFCLVLLAVLSALPVAQIVIGAVFLDDCPVAKYIPVYLIVMGVACLVKFLSILCQNVRQRNSENGAEQQKAPSGFDQILNVFLLVWFILGNRWVYGAHFTSNPVSTNFCHSTVYYFAYWSINSFYILCATACLLLCVMACLCGANQRQA
ncbi:transmembrane protein 272-like [Ylistrum balloti]|uniref:transmembrane protein 272-like n=1 Tax=Ylistrum balloti TaxID=509963 RepID=UPI0029059DEE|nr:transmembrane protein 272-like [Ylistrum balloti]